MKAPDPPHWTLNSCFGVFRTIWVHLGPLCCLTKLGAKRVKLVQKFVPRSRVRIFRNEPTQSTPLDPKLLFWCISYHLGAFATIRLPYKTRGKTFMNKCKSSWHEDVSEFFATNAPDPPHWTLNTCFGAFLSICMHLGPLGCLTKLRAKHSELVQKFVRRGRVGVFNDERTRSTPLDPNLMFWCVSYHLGAFGTVWLPYEILGAKRAELVQNFVPRSRIELFRNERTRSTPLDPKLMFWCVSYCLGAFGTIMLPCETRGKTGLTSAKVRATKSH